MPDFNFSGLGTRGFEHLVQALSLAELGNSVTVFGDGPDGGREATFEGSTRFRGLGADENWNGYGVVQAKYRQRLTTTSVDAQWALDQLATEIKGYSKLKSKRRPPEYYIFATNVVLTPGQDAGSKDKARKMLADWSAQPTGPRGYAIWDYDQVATLLALHPGVRQTFLAWTLPGDVLSALVDRIDASRVDLKVTLPAFLQKELLRDQYAKLEQAGHSPDDPISLATVFIDLPISPVLGDADQAVQPRYEANHQADYAVRTLIGEANAPLNVRISSSTKGPPAGRTVLLGGPGQGKTTIGQYLCQLYRVALLKSVDPGHIDVDALAEIGRIEGQAAASDLALPTCRRLPFRIVLSEYAARIAEEPESGPTVLQQIARQVAMRTDSKTSPDDIKELLSSYPSLVVFDGLDEVPPSSNRASVLENIRDFEIDARAAGMDVYVLVTTRPQGYGEELSPAKYSHRALSPLSPDDALAYGSLLASTRFGGDQDRLLRVRSRLTAAVRGQATAWLMRSPLQVTIMVLLVDQHGHPPEERWALFSAYYELVCRREVERDIEPSRVIRENRHHIDQVHRRVGLFLQTKTENAGMTESRLSLDEFHEVVLEYLDEEGFDVESAGALAAEIESAASQRLVFLVGLEEGTVGFEVRSLQEFMAAEALVEGNDDILLGRLRAIAPIEYWENVLLFSIGKLFKQRAYLRDSVVALCQDLNEEQADYLSRRTVAGSRLASAILSDNLAGAFPKYMRRFAEVASQGLGEPGFWDRSSLVTSYSVATSAVIDSRLRELLRPGLVDRQAGRDAWAVACGLTSAGRWDPEEWLALATANPTLLTNEAFWIAARREYDSIRIRTLLGEALLAQPVRQVIAQMEADGPVRKAIERLLPDASHKSARIVQRAIGQSHAGRQLRVELVGTQGSVEMRAVAASRDTAEQEDSVADGPLDWLTVALLADYEASPGPESLARFVEAFDRLEPVDKDWLEALCRSRASWPLSATVDFLQSSHDSGQALADGIRAGVLGDLSAWQDMQTRWSKDGCALTSISPGVPEGVPFRVGRGAPVAWRAARYSVVFPFGANTYKDLDFVTDALRITRESVSEDAKRVAWELASYVCILGMFRTSAEPSADAESSGKYSAAFLEMLSCGVEVGVPMERDDFWAIEGLIRFGSFEGDASPEAMKALGRLASSWPFHNYVSEGVEALARQSLAGSMRLELLPLVASGAQRATAFRAFDARAYISMPTVESSPLLFAAVCTILARQERLSDEHIAAFLAAVDGGMPGALTALFRAAELRPESVDEFVHAAGIVERIVQEGSPVHEELVEVIFERAAGRVSELGSRDFCRRLELPTFPARTGHTLRDRRSRRRGSPRGVIED